MEIRIRFIVYELLTMIAQGGKWDAWSVPVRHRQTVPKRISIRHQHSMGR